MAQNTWMLDDYKIIFLYVEWWKANFLQKVMGLKSTFKKIEDIKDFELGE